MSGRLTRHAYEQLIAEDLEWLEKQPRSLERDHIAVVLRESADATYGPTRGAEPNPAKEVLGNARSAQRWTVVGLYERGKYIRDAFVCYIGGLSAVEAKNEAVRVNAERGDKIEVIACVAGGGVAHAFDPEVPTRPRTATGASLRHDAALDKNAVRAQRDALWQLLDDIDTLDDSARGHDNVFRDKAREIQKKRWAIHNPDDPRGRCELCMDLVDNRWRRCPNTATRVVSDDRGRPLHICEEHFKRAAASWIRSGAPQCGCGRPSTHESGWCGTECEAKFGGTVIVVHKED